MEPYIFNIDEVEKQLQEIKSIFIILYFVANGLKNLDLIDNEELSGFEFAIEEGNKRVDDLLNSMKQV